MTLLVLLCIAFGAWASHADGSQDSCGEMGESEGCSAPVLARDSMLLQRSKLDIQRAAVSLHGNVSDDPVWGCGMVGTLPGITQDGETTMEMQRLIDGIKGSSSFNKATFWNWNVAPQSIGGTTEHLSKDFLFMPELWGIGPISEDALRPAGQSNFLDTNGRHTPATMGNILLGMNEPDIYGSCMGNLFGKCGKSCSDDAVRRGDCPIGYPYGSSGEANSAGECNCWQHSYASGVGFWGVEGCAAEQPLPTLWEDDNCAGNIMAKWKQTARIAYKKGYRYLSTPLVAVDIGYAKKFIERACTECQDASCGCPVYVGFHFYAFDCQPATNGGYDTFRQRLAAVADVMKTFPFVKGAIINEVGMLNCASDPSRPICVPNNGDYPANKHPDHKCPPSPDLPDGLPTFMDNLFDIMLSAKTSDGRSIVKGFSWFNEHEAGGTYNLGLFEKDGSVNELGEAYIRGCSKWGAQNAAA